MSPKKTLEEINRRFFEVPRRSMIHLLGLTVLVLTLSTIARAQDRPPIFQQMFNAYGFDSFGQIEKIRYTFNLEAPGLNLSRSWEWEPKTDLISYEGKGSDGKPVKVTYSRSQLGSQSDVVKNEIDPAFSNDNYWLLLVLHFSWDGSATVTRCKRLRCWTTLISSSQGKAICSGRTALIFLQSPRSSCAASWSITHASGTR